MNVENFEESFRTGTSGCIRTCECGITYYNPDNIWTFEDGELEKLEKDPETIGLDYSVSTIEFEGKEYVCSCDCWHERAEKIMDFLDSHIYGIAEYFKLEKQRKQEKVNNIPDVIDMESD